MTPQDCQNTATDPSGGINLLYGDFGYNYICNRCLILAGKTHPPNEFSLNIDKSDNTLMPFVHYDQNDASAYDIENSTRYENNKSNNFENVLNNNSSSDDMKIIIYDFDDEVMDEAIDETMIDVDELTDEVGIDTKGDLDDISMKNQTSLDQPETTESGSNSSNSTTTSKNYIPVLKGCMTHNSPGKVSYSGLWGYNLDSLTKTFEFKLQSTNSPGKDKSFSYPMDGTYSGYFYVETGKRPLKVPDVLNLTFTRFKASPFSDLIYKVSGSSKNKFGNFNVEGELELNGELILYKYYASISTESNLVKRKRTNQSLVGKFRLSSLPNMIDINSSYLSVGSGGKIKYLELDWRDVATIIIVHLIVISEGKTRFFSLKEITNCIIYNW
jgi:hypothetical protein